MFFLLEERVLLQHLGEEEVLLPPQGEGWDGGGFTSGVILRAVRGEPVEP
jgi:hypothetical protein